MKCRTQTCKERLITSRIGVQLRRERTAKGWSQEKLALEIGVSGQTVQKYETGAVRLNSTMANIIAGILGTSVAAIVDVMGEST